MHFQLRELRNIFDVQFFFWNFNFCFCLHFASSLASLITFQLSFFSSFSLCFVFRIPLFFIIKKEESSSTGERRTRKFNKNIVALINFLWTKFYFCSVNINALSLQKKNFFIRCAVCNLLLIFRYKCSIFCFDIKLDTDLISNSWNAFGLVQLFLCKKQNYKAFCKEGPV